MFPWVVLFDKKGLCENGAMPIVKGNNCQLDCPEKCRWQSWNYRLGNWETDKELSFSCEQEEIDKNSETSDTPLLLIETPGKKNRQKLWTSHLFDHYPLYIYNSNHVYSFFNSTAENEPSIDNSETDSNSDAEIQMLGADSDEITENDQLRRRRDAING